MNEVYILFRETDKGDVVIRCFKNEYDAVEEGIYLSTEYPEYHYSVRRYDVEG